MRTEEEILNNPKLKVISVMREGEALRINGNFYDPVSQKKYYCIFTSSLGWEHASVSTPNKTPSWEIMCRIKDIFWSGDECCIEYHPKEEDYVNMHEHCLHIWKPIGIEIPMPPSIMIGFKEVSSEQSKALSKYIVNQMTFEQKLKASGLHLNRSMQRKRRKKVGL